MPPVEHTQGSAEPKDGAWGNGGGGAIGREGNAIRAYVVILVSL